MQVIQSDKNPRIKNLIKLIEKSKQRKSQCRFVVEGRQENSFALQSTLKPLEFYIQHDLFKDSISLPSESLHFEVSLQVYRKIAYRQITEGIIGIYEYPTFTIDDLELGVNPFILIIESIEKPGNLGAICRTADAFGVDLVILTDEKADVYNPNAIRSSVGSIFNIPILSLSKEKTAHFLQHRNIPIYATYMNQRSVPIQEIDYTNPTSILFGTEHSGVSDFWLSKIDANILISMYGKVDSLNVSNAVAIAAYEVRRQRG